MIASLPTCSVDAMLGLDSTAWSKPMAGANEDLVAQIAATLMAGAGRAEHSDADIQRAVRDAYRVVEVVTEQGKQRRAKQAAAQDAAPGPGHAKTNYEPLG
jgi:hypothetical protein